MPWAKRTAKMIAEPRDFHEGPLIRGVNFGDLRCKDEVDSSALADLEVSFEGAWIAKVVLIRPKLKGVHKNADGNKI
jgi:hypothetical protein